jgi:U3 small nucleolar RNA-associated protein 4
MDIHRCRFVPYPPQSINALAFSKTSDTQKQCPRDQRLAIGRANGDIEIWNPAKGLWSQETIFRGGKDRSIEGLAWTQDLEEESDEDDERKGAGRLRLFSIGFSSAVTEWDLARGVPARQANGNFGAIWCLAAQPRWTPPRGEDSQPGSSYSVRNEQYLAAGCEDGTLVLFSTEDGDLRYLRTIAKPPTKKPRMLSLTWKDRNTIVAGCSDSNIRVYDIRNRQTVRNMSLGKSAIGGNETLVWAVKCLPNGTILSGDSAGDLKIWDGNNYSLVQRLHCHEADILDITMNANGSTIITGGADRRTVAYKSMPVEKGEGNRRWAQVMHRRFHEHDVKTLVSFESQDLSIVVSGGLDTAPVVMPLRGWQKEYHRTLSHLPQSPQVSSAPQARLFISWWDRQISIWHLSRHSRTPELSERHTLLAQILVKGEENITSARISDDGKYLAVATVSNIKVFVLRLRRSSSDGGIGIRTKKLETLASLERFGARLVLFSPDSRWLCSIRSNNDIALVRIETTTDGKTPPQFNKHVVKLNRSSLETSTNPKMVGLGQYLDSINNVSFSTDSRLLAVGDLSGRIATWVLEGLEESSNGLVNGIDENSKSDTHRLSHSPSSDDESSDDEDDSVSIHGQRWRKNPAGAFLPTLDALLLTMSFRPSAPEKQVQTARADVGSHPTRHTPHPHAHDLPTGEDRLIVVTAEHKVIEFRVLQGMLSDWSRRNPASYLPRQFQQIRERAMGCFWDVSNSHERLWTYGSTWMFMLDLAQDLPSKETIDPAGAEDAQQPQQSSKQKKKRKREEFEAEALRSRGSGAGGTVSLFESYVGVGSQVRKFQSPKREDSKTVQLDETTWAGNDEDEEPVWGKAPLAQLRRRAKEGEGEEVLVNGNEKHRLNGVTSHSHEPLPSNLPPANKGAKSASYLSLKYRSILGIVSMSGESHEGFEMQSGQESTTTAPQTSLEVAIIERPLWDVDLPERFDGGQDWET